MLDNLEIQSKNSKIIIPSKEAMMPPVRTIPTPLTAEKSRFQSNIDGIT